MSIHISNATRFTEDHLEFSDTDDTFLDEHGEMWTAEDLVEELRGILFDGDMSKEDPIGTLHTVQALINLDIAEDYQSMEMRSEDKYDPIIIDETPSQARGEHLSTTP